MAVISMVVGAVTDSNARFVAKVDTGPVRVAVADNAGMAGPIFFGPEDVDAQGVAKVEATGLDPDTRFWWQVEDNGVLDTSTTGQLLTDPPLGTIGTFTMGVAGDAGLSPDTPGTGTVLAASRLSNHSIFDTIRSRALAEGWRRFCHLGDLHYYDLGSGDHGITGGGSLANYRASYDDVLTQPRQHQLYREVSWQYLWDDHDYGPNNSDGTLATKGNAATVFRERVPHYDLAAGAGENPIYHSFVIRRTLFVCADVRYNRSPNTDPDGPSKTMLGAAQKTWMDQLLATSNAKFLVWVMPDQWKGVDTDSWTSFATEQAELVQLFGDRGWLDRMCILGADAHMVALDTGSSSAGGIPVLHAAALDASPTGNPEDFDLGGRAGREQHGSITVDDKGSRLVVTLTGWAGTSPPVSHTLTVAGDPPPPLSSGALLRSLSGSHTATFEARVVTSFQTGDNPDGETIPILGGDVHFDGTAEIRANLELETSGILEATGDSAWPRRAGSLLAPYGNEVFVRRGVDFGGAGILWILLGYFRINSPEQDDAPFGPIRISGQDRMAGIVDGRLLAPRELAAGRTVASVFAELVQEIYPLAIVLFDDSGQTTLGRTLVAEESRYQVLRDLAESLGKIMFWDGQGFLRVETAPDPATPVWEVNAGRDGVQLTTGRRLTREGVYNAVVATGEAGDDDEPVRAVAVDANPRSPTFFGGRFGKVPRFFSSPLLTTNAQAATAARNMLRRSIGMPFSVDFQSVVNPSLRPFDPVRVTLQDGNREIHVVETVSVPLDEQTSMSATTREQTLVVVGGV